MQIPESAADDDKKEEKVIIDFPIDKDCIHNMYNGKEFITELEANLLINNLTGQLIMKHSRDKKIENRSTKHL